MNRSSARRIIALSLILSSSSLLGITDEGKRPDPVTEAEGAGGGDFQKQLFEVGQLFSQRKFEEASRKLDEIEKIAPQSKEIESYRAGILAETGKYEEARAIYTKQIQEDPSAFAPRFNLNETKLLQKDYSGARKGFEELHQEFPSVDFLLFKLVLCALQEKDVPAAQEWAKKLYRGQRNPLIYYAAAAIAFSQGDIKNGKGLIQAAEAEFGSGRHALLYQSLAEVGVVVGGEYPPKPQKKEAP